jgi:hypothetical protein
MDLITLRQWSVISDQGWKLPRGMTDKVFDSASVRPQHDWSAVVRHPALGFRVDPTQVQLFPHLFEQFVNVPSMFGADGTGVRNPVEQIQLLNGDGVDLVERIHHRNIRSTLCFENIDDIINGGITADGNVR